MRKKLSILISTFNCEDIVEKCLKSVTWADEIFIVDSYSTDQTLEICRKYTDRIIQHEYINNATQNNWSIPQLKHEWVMIVDSDEVITPELRKSIENILEKEEDEFNGYYVYRLNYFLGKSINYSGERKDKSLRLFKHDMGRCEDKRVHAKKIIDGKAGYIENGYLEHYQQRDMVQYFKKFNRYTTWSAEQLYKEGKRPTIYHFTIRPAFKFIQTYFIQLGFLDGIYGFFWCVLASIYVFTKYLKLWEIYNKQKKSL
ncbi:MAG: glycosyltransferase family 2 protein [Candidatus Firestonebacteria bacterium]|nr:glycosyltransferase family 2 protein [Candidatus Firestonebacteria bacterium]